MPAHFHADGRVTLTSDADPERVLVLEGYGTPKFDEAAYVAFFEQDAPPPAPSPESRVIDALKAAGVIDAAQAEAVMATIETVK